MHILGNILLVGVGGFVGSVARYSVSLLVKGTLTTWGWAWKWPLATFAVNLIGSILVGVLWGKVAQTSEPSLILTLGIAGFCGGFTTFSAFSFEIVELLRTGHYGLSLAYIAVSVILCVVGAFLGLMLAKG